MKQATFDGLPEIEELESIYRQIKKTCPYHTWITVDEFVEIEIKSTGEKVKRCNLCEHRKNQEKEARKKEWQQEKEKLSDWYIRQTFVRGNKFALPMHEYPQELIEAKRAALQIKKIVTTPLKECHRHGKLFREQVIKGGLKNGKQVYKCKECVKEIKQKNYDLNKSKILAKQAEYRKNNEKRVREIKKKSWEKTRLTVLSDPLFRNKERKRHRLSDQQSRKDLSDRYIRKLLCKHSDLSQTEIPESLVEMKRVLVQLKRGIKLKSDETLIKKIGEIENGKD